MISIRSTDWQRLLVEQDCEISEDAGRSRIDDAGIESVAIKIGNDLPQQNRRMC